MLQNCFQTAAGHGELSKMRIISTLQEKPFGRTLCGLQEYGSFQADAGAFQPICRINKEM
jgi:hypothetical protein